MSAGFSSVESLGSSLDLGSSMIQEPTHQGADPSSCRLAESSRAMLIMAHTQSISAFEQNPSFDACLKMRSGRSNRRPSSWSATFYRTWRRTVRECCYPTIV